MDAADYWPTAREYSIWNAAIASLQFWTADLDPDTLGRVYTTFFYSPSSHTLCQQSDEILFGCFVVPLNAAFDQQLSLADEGYESGSDTIDLPTPLKRLQESTMFPAWNMLHLIQHLSHHAVHHKLHPDQYADAYPSVQQTTTLQTALQNVQKKMKQRTSRGYLWMMNIGLLRKYPKRLCIHEHG